MHGILLGSGAFLCPVRRSSSVHPTLKLTLRINISRGAPDRYAGLSHLRYARRPEKHAASAKAWLCKVAKRFYHLIYRRNDLIDFLSYASHSATGKRFSTISFIFTESSSSKNLRTSSRFWLALRRNKSAGCISKA